MIVSKLGSWRAVFCSYKYHIKIKILNFDNPLGEVARFAILSDIGKIIKFQSSQTILCVFYRRK